MIGICSFGFGIICICRFDMIFMVYSFLLLFSRLRLMSAILVFRNFFVVSRVLRVVSSPNMMISFVSRVDTLASMSILETSCRLLSFSMVDIMHLLLASLNVGKLLLCSPGVRVSALWILMTGCRCFTQWSTMHLSKICCWLTGWGQGFSCVRIDNYVHQVSLVLKNSIRLILLIIHRTFIERLTY